MEQKTGGRLGQAAAELQELYNLANGSHASSIFHDVTVGNNSVPCSSGSPDCVQNSAGSYFESGYNTTAGYDLATGLGSVDATQLVNYWSASTGAMAVNVSASPTPNPVTTVEVLSVAVSLTGGSGTPSGTVTLSDNGFTATGTLNASGDYTFTVPAGSLMIGNDTLTITYSGDSTYAATNITTPVQVNGLTATVMVNPVASINSNQSLTVSGTVSGSGGTPTGSVTLTGGGYTSPATALSNGSYSITIPSGSLSAGSDLLTVTYGGNSIYDGGAFATTTVGVTLVVVLTPTVTVTPASTSIYSSQSLNVSVTVAGSGATPTGFVTLTGGGYSSGAQMLAASGSCTAALCTITIPPNSLSNSVAGKSDMLTSTYSGDVNYNPGSASASVTVAESVYSVASSAPAAVSPGGSTTSTVTVELKSLLFGNRDAGVPADEFSFRGAIPADLLYHQRRNCGHERGHSFSHNIYRNGEHDGGYQRTGLSEAARQRMGRRGQRSDSGVAGVPGSSFAAPELAADAGHCGADGGNRRTGRLRQPQLH